MKLEEAIKMVQDCPSSIFTNENAIKILEMLEESGPKMTEGEFFLLKKELKGAIEYVFDQESFSREVEVSELEISLNHDNEIQIDSVCYSTGNIEKILKRSITNHLKNQ